MNNETEPKPCPFCGAKSITRWEKENMLSVGCSEISMLCPTPAMVIYKDENGKYNYQYWNRRA